MRFFPNKIIHSQLDKTPTSVTVIMLSSASFKLSRRDAGSKLGASC